MARKDQPYLPLYVQDFMTDEKLMECSASATGVYIRIMCILHKTQPYGSLLLKQKDKQNDKQIINFAKKFAKFLPFELAVVLDALEELVHEGCLIIEGDTIYQKRMVDDGQLSDQRSIAGKNGVAAKRIFAEAKPQANPDIDNDIDNENKILLKGGKFSDFKLEFTDALKQSCLEILSRSKFGTKDVVTADHVENFFGIFCKTYEKSTEYYKDEEAVWLHFKRWLPKQKINGKETGNNRGNSAGSVYGNEKGKGAHAAGL